MTRVLCYTSPAHGHLYPTVPVLLELRRRGYDVSLVTLSSEVGRMNQLGLRARPIAAGIEAIAMDDWKATSTAASLNRAMAAFGARAELEPADLEAAIAAERPDLLLVDLNSWGAAAVAQKSGLPWALFMPYLLPWRLPGVPPFGPGLKPRPDFLGRARDALVRKVVHGLVNKNLPKLNGMRAKVGVPPLPHLADSGIQAPCVLYYSAEPFTYPGPLPASVKPIGPPMWEPPEAEPEWLAAIDKPIVLVTCSTEYQADGKLISVTLEALKDEEVFVVATTAALDPKEFTAPPNARVERFVPHAAILKRAACVVGHGGMGITQKALSAGVPVCVVPFGRDQLEVAMHVEVANAGVQLKPGKLTAKRVREAVARARTMKDGAARIASAFHQAGGASTGVDALEGLLMGGPASQRKAG